jgi:hypothetical protein
VRSAALIRASPSAAAIAAMAPMMARASALVATSCMLVSSLVSRAWPA